MKEQFKEIKFGERVSDLIAKANLVIGEYAAQGYDLSVRQLYYQFVARNWLRNTDTNYNNLASAISDARLAGMLDWDAIKDRGRVTHERSTHESIATYLQTLNQHYRRNKWKTQTRHVSVMVEKQALEGVLLPVCDRWEVAFTSNKGYSSSSTMYERGKYLQSMRDVEGKEVHVLYLGDHDPSGIDMSRDVEDRLQMFSDGCVHVHRLALNIDQVNRWHLPENPAKLTDSRAPAYVEQFGNSSWELDAIAPDVLAGIVEREIKSLIDHTEWQRCVDLEFEERNKLQDIITELEQSP